MSKRSHNLKILKDFVSIYVERKTIYKTEKSGFNIFIILIFFTFKIKEQFKTKGIKCDSQKKTSKFTIMRSFISIDAFIVFLVYFIPIFMHFS